MADERLVETFVELADTLVDDFDVIDFLHLLVERSVELLNADAAGLLLADHNGQLQVMASSNENVRVLELFQIQNDEGPCLDAFATGHRVSNADLRAGNTPWARFAPAAVDAGFTSVDALPMRLRNQVIGALNLFRVDAGELTALSLRKAQALVDVATIGLLQERAIRHQEIITEQLHRALNSRIVIEQVKGLLAERLGIGMDVAFTTLRGYARANHRKLGDLAGEVISGEISAEDLLADIDAAKRRTGKAKRARAKPSTSDSPGDQEQPQRR